MSLPRYDNYKDSGVEWIGEIPEGWEVKKLKYVAKINPTKDQSINSDSLEPVTFLPMERVGENGEIDCEVRKPIKDLWSGFTFFKKNDVIIAKITPCFENGKGALLDKLETEFGFGSTEFHVLRGNSNTYAGFLFYLTKSEIFMKIGEAFMTGAAGQKRVPTDFISEFAFSVPPLPEQTAIASFLDRKTAEVDLLIANKEKLIALYEEEKTAIINRAVTKGLDPAVKTKPSGVDWLGDIPEHWEVKRLKYVAFIKYGLGQPPKEKSDGLPIIRATNVFRGKIDTNNLVFVDPTDVPYERDPILREDDIIVVRSGAYTADSAIISKEFDGAVAGYDMVIRCYRDVPKFISYCLLSNYVLKKQLLLHAIRAAQPHLNREELGETIILLPPSSEQTAIVTQIETECARLDTIIDKFKKQIELFKEYRTTLISEVVTGKIDVRGEVTL